MRLPLVLALLALLAVAEASDAAAVSGDGSGTSLAAANAALVSSKAAMAIEPARAASLARDAELLIEQHRPSAEQSIMLASARWLRAEALVRTNNTAAASPILDAALAVVSRGQPTSKLHGDLLVTRAGIETSRGEAQKALADYQRAFEIFGKVHEPRSQAIALQNIGSIYQDARDFERALYYYSVAADTYPDDLQLGLSSANNKANALSELGRYADAEREFGRALALATALHSAPSQTLVLTNIAQRQIDTGNLSAASATLARGTQIGRGSSNEVIYALQGTAAQLALAKGQPRQAAGLVESALAFDPAIAETQPYKLLHRTAYLAYRELGDSARSLKHLEVLKRLEEQARSLAASTNASLMAARFDFANQNARIARLKTGQLQRDVELTQLAARQNMIILGGLLALVTVVASLLGLYLASLKRSRDAIRAANEQLTVVNADLGEALLAKSQFLATTSHEIRTPLNGVLGMTQLLLVDPKVGGDVRERISLVHDAGEAMRALVDDILDFAKLDAGGIEIHRTSTDLPQLLSDVVGLWQGRADEQSLRLTLEVDASLGRINEDGRRLRQILSNLLSNAIKFTLEGSVVVRVTVTPDATGELLAIAVEDSGIGIPDDAHDVVFEKFRQLDGGTTRRFSGTGLGLAISQGLARAMGGDIELVSVVGTGSTFTVRLPLERLSSPERAITRATRKPVLALADAGLLLVGANPIVAGTLRALLTPQVATFAVAADLGVAAAEVAARPLDVVLIDGTALQAGLPDLGALQQLVANIDTFAARAVILWPNAVPAEITLLQRSGVAAVVSKPVSSNELLRRLRTLFEEPVIVAKPLRAATVGR